MNQLLIFMVLSMVAGFLAGLFTRSMRYEEQLSALSVALTEVTVHYNRLFRRWVTVYGSAPAPLIDAEWQDGEVLCFTVGDRSSLRFCTPEEDSTDGTA